MVGHEGFVPFGTLGVPISITICLGCIHQARYLPYLQALPSAYRMCAFETQILTILTFSRSMFST